MPKQDGLGSPEVLLRSATSPTSAPNGTTTAERVTAFFDELSDVAADLNAASDGFGDCVVALDDALKTLNLGIATWVRVVDRRDSNDDFWVHKLGYTKIGQRWGIAIRTVEGNYGWADQADADEWLFNDAPRALRLEAIDKVPELLEQLIKEARATTAKIKEKTTQTADLTAAIKRAAATLKGRR
jgi:hypothetical protein